MAKPRTDLKALRNLISEAELILSTTVLPEGRSQRARELLKAAVALTDDLLALKPAAPEAVKALEDVTLMESIARLRSVQSPLGKMADPLAALHLIRHGPEGIGSE